MTRRIRTRKPETRAQKDARLRYQSRQRALISFDDFCFEQVVRINDMGEAAFERQRWRRCGWTPEEDLEEEDEDQVAHQRRGPAFGLGWANPYHYDRDREFNIIESRTTLGTRFFETEDTDV